MLIASIQWGTPSIDAAQPSACAVVRNAIRTIAASVAMNFDCEHREILD